MKHSLLTILFGALTLFPDQSPSQTGSPPPRARPGLNTIVPRKLATADLSNIRLNATNGSLVFTAAGIEYLYYPHPEHSNEVGASAVSVSACIALLAELRRADTFEVYVPMESDTKQFYIHSLTITIDKLK